MRWLLHAWVNVSLCALMISSAVAPLVWLTWDAGTLGESVRVMGGMMAGMTWGVALVLAALSLAWWIFSLVVSGRDAIEEEFVVREQQRVLTRAELRGALHLPTEQTLEGALSLEGPASP